MFIKARTRNLQKKKYQKASFAIVFRIVSFEVPLTFYSKIGEIPSAAYPQKLQEQIPESLQIRPQPVLHKIPIASDGEYCINF